MNALRLAWLSLSKQPVFLLTTVLTLALGIGLVTTQYSLLDATLIKPLPFPDGERIWHVSRAGAPANGNWSSIDLQEFRVQREGQQSFEQLAGFRSETYNLSTGDGPPQRLWGSAVTAEFFELLRVPPILGRSFVQGEDQPGAPLKAVIGHAVWRDGLGGDPAVIGRTVRLNGESAEIIGVMPEGFVFPTTDTVWVNLRLPAAGSPLDPMRMVQGLGLLSEGVRPEAAAAELELGARRFRTSRGLPEDDVEPMQVTRLQRVYFGGSTLPMLATLLAMTLFVLLLACINVANLLYIRAADRARDLALRRALGAGRAQLIRHLMAESVLITLLGAGVGVGLAALGVELLHAQIFARIDMIGWVRFDLNLRVLAVAIVAAGSAGLVAGLIPAWRASRVDVALILRSDGRGSVGGSGRGRRWMVAGQLAFACTALIVATLMAQSASRSAELTLAYDPDTLVIGRLELQGPAYAEAEARTRFYATLVERVAQQPGVAAAAASSRDLVNSGVPTPVQVEGVSYARSQDMDDAYLEVVTRDYFDVVDRQALRGRLFEASDRYGSTPVALINPRFAERFFPGRDPIGLRIRDGRGENAWATIVGIVPDLDLEGVGSRDDGAGYYRLQDQMAWGWLELLVRGEPGVAPIALTATVREAVATLDPEQPVHTIRTLRERTDRRIAVLALLGQMATVFAGVALLLAGIGIYGVVAYAARQRTREFGLRIALGARPAGIVALQLRQSGLVALLGTLAGLIGGYLLSKPLAPILPMVSTHEPGLYLAVGLVLAVVTALACWLPARRAAAVDPQVALRAE
jgi:putative ABC transport system permease protein